MGAVETRKRVLPLLEAGEAEVAVTVLRRDVGKVEYRESVAGHLKRMVVRDRDAHRRERLGHAVHAGDQRLSERAIGVAPIRRRQRRRIGATPIARSLRRWSPAWTACPSRS